jgi:acetyl-CoA synthetase
MAETKLTYEQVREGFNWDDFNKETFDWNPGKKFNLAHEVDRHAKDPKKVAIFYILADGKEEKYTYRELRNLTSQFANVLTRLGIKKGDRVAVLLSRTIECYISFLGIWKAGAVEVPLFTAFEADAISYRVKDSGAKLIVTDAENRGKLERIEGGLPGVDVIVVCGERGLGIYKGDLSFWQEVSNASREFATVETSRDDPAVLEYTSGTTGAPKGTIIPHGGPICVIAYAKDVLEVREDDMFWGFIDPGWTYGLLSAGTSLLVLGRSLIVYGGRPDAKAWYDIMERYEVTNFTAGPTLFRMVRAAGENLPKQYKLKIRRLCSAGEYLDPETSLWFKQQFGVPVADQYGITEVAMVVCNYPFMELKPGSMGRPFIGLDVELIDEEANKVSTGETGIIAVKRSKYFLANGYWQKPEKWEECFIKGTWFNTGDLAAEDKDGYYFFRGRADDIISTAGYRVGPGEMEAVLMEHPAVAEVGVVGKPDPQRGEIIKAFVVLKPGFEASDQLAKELISFTRNRYSRAAYPREVEFLSALPKTESGKILHRELRKRA